MRRFDVYFLQKRSTAGWDTLERAQSASVLIASVVREFDGQEDAELRVVAGDWNEAIGEWEFSQIFFVDRGSIDLRLAESAEEDDEPAASWSTGSDRAGGTDDSLEADLPPERAQTPGADTGATGSGFAAAIRAASEQAEQEAAGATEDDSRTAPEDPLDMPEPANRSERSSRRGTRDDDTNEDLRSLGFVHGDLDAEDLDVPPPEFRPEPRRGGRLFFMIGTLLIAVLLILGSAAALMVAFKVDPAPRYIEMFKQWRAGGDFMLQSEETTSGPVSVVPQTVGQVARFDGVVPELRGRWSAGDCAEEYIEFDVDGFVVAAPGRPPSVKVPVTETLTDDYTWYLRRSDTLVEHFQRLGDSDIQMIGDTTPVGFTQRTSEVFTRCP